MHAMTYRIYLRWPDQKVSDKTTTESPSVAQVAFDELKNRRDLHGKPVGVALTQDGKQISYFDFSKLNA